VASNLQDRLYEIFAAAAGEQTRFPVRDSSVAGQTEGAGASETAAVSKNVLDLVRQTVVEAVTSTPSTQSQATSSSVLSSIVSLLPGGGAVTDAAKQAESGESTVESIATTLLKSAFGLVPLVSGLFGLFGGGDQEAAPPPLIKYAMPSPIEFDAGENGGQAISSVDYDQMGRPRSYAPASAGAARSAAGESGNGVSGAQITVNVNAMDARSFLDRSSDIAAAVRDAMLNLNSINDVVNEL
jgi:hypothetical protein